MRTRFLQSLFILPSMNTRYSISNIAHISTTTDNRFLHLTRIELHTFSLHMMLISFSQDFVCKDICMVRVNNTYLAPFCDLKIPSTCPQGAQVILYVHPVASAAALKQFSTFSLSSFNWSRVTERV